MAQTELYLPALLSVPPGLHDYQSMLSCVSPSSVLVPSTPTPVRESAGRHGGGGGGGGGGREREQMEAAP